MYAYYHIYVYIYKCGIKWWYAFIATSSETCGQKSLPQRIRKPNSKYSSDSIYCPIAEKLKQVNGSDEKIIESENLTPQKLEKSKKSEETKSPTKVQETSFNNERKDSAM